MESLLGLSVDNISSRDNSKIRKGLRQIEGLLVQLCLPKSSRSPNKRKSSALSDKVEETPKQLDDLKNDAAFREFFRLQEGFQWNVAQHLVTTLDRLLGMGSSSQNDLLIVSALELLQGILLLHPPSRRLFAQEVHMNILLDLLDSENPPKIQSHTLLVLVTALLDCPRNTRTFEDVDGLLTVTSLFKSRGTAKDVKMKSLEFLYFYLMPESPLPTLSTASAPNTAVLQRSPSKSANVFDERALTHSGDSGSAMDLDLSEDVRTIYEKQDLLGQYLSNVAELVQDLDESAPFTAAPG
ncbi:cell division control 14, SIN component [Polychaeton citri CBS 116435]|uniref:Cell division control 14, SIN component n=1 Tax=Polychaeton citri CBS 116435 TaxID=1314669 RepID=A0A9P4QJ57_9PEZI|nr:cell division control 14, SIN component [Polychaeton citri CBS 116435]